MSVLASPVPTLIGRGVISSEAPEFAFTLSRDGRTAWFNRASDDRATLRIMRSDWDGSTWTAPVVAAFSGTHADVDPHVIPGSDTLLFSSDRPRPGGGKGGFDTWIVVPGSTVPRHTETPLNSDSTDIYITRARDGTAVFASARRGRAQIHETRLVDGRWSDPVAVTLGASTEGGNPAIAPSGRFLVFVRSGPGGDPDLWYSCRTSAGWSDGTRLHDRVNSQWTEFAPSISADERVLFFTSERPGVAGSRPVGTRPPGDIYAVAVNATGIACASR